QISLDKDFEDLCCPVCQDVYRDPVVLFCSHSFCRRCLKSWWEGKKKLECPLFTKPEVFCRPHGERFKLFCVDDEELLCLVCQHSDGHYGHKLQPVNEVAQGRRNELRKALRPLLDKLKVFKEEKGNLDQTAEYIKLQAQQTEGRIKEQFRKLHLFLHKEEDGPEAAAGQTEGVQRREGKPGSDRTVQEASSVSPQGGRRQDCCSEDRRKQEDSEGKPKDRCPE
uniref:Uncharacterized protein n=1 Tax=Poecilia latipinna TaxID=48699 RepID=A0A3B3UB23_9TELE